MKTKNGNKEENKRNERNKKQEREEVRPRPTGHLSQLPGLQRTKSCAIQELVYIGAVGGGPITGGLMRSEQEVDQGLLGINYSGLLTFWSHDFSILEKNKRVPKELFFTVWDIKD